jgi:hypothetical protein
MTRQAPLSCKSRVQVDPALSRPTHTCTRSSTHDDNNARDVAAEYRLVAKKGEGTFSEVLKAQCVKNGKYVAIKCMKNHFDSLDQVRKHPVPVSTQSPQTGHTSTRQWALRCTPARTPAHTPAAAARAYALLAPSSCTPQLYSSRSQSGRHKCIPCAVVARIGACGRMAVAAMQPGNTSCRTDPRDAHLHGILLLWGRISGNKTP